MCHNDANKMTRTLCHMRHSPNFEKIYSFLKPVLNIFILRNFILGWGRAGIFHRYIDLGNILIIGRSRIHQRKSWYYLEPVQISKVEVFAKIVFGYKTSNFLCENLQHRCLTVSIRGFQ